MLKSMEIKQEIDELTADIKAKMTAGLPVAEDVQAKLKAKIEEYKSAKADESDRKSNEKGVITMTTFDAAFKKQYSAALRNALIGKPSAEDMRILDSATGTNGATNSNGGYLVPTQLLGLKENNGAAVDLREICTVIPVHTRSGSVPTIDYGQNVVLVAFDENNALTEKTPTFGTVSFSLASKGAIVPVSRELLMDADTDVLGVVGKLLKRIYMKDVNTGILTAALSAATSKGTPSYMASKDTINAIKTAINSLPLDAGGNATVIIPQASWAALANVADNNGHYLLARDAFDTTIRAIEGRPVIVVEDGELTALNILVGDFSAMYHIAYPELEIASSEEAGFAKNSVLVRAVCRHTSICTYAGAFFKITASNLSA